MRTILERKSWVMAFASVCVLAVCGALTQTRGQDSTQQSSDNVADAARKARDQKKKEAAKTKKVYTNDEMGTLPSHGVSTVGQDGAGASAEGAKGQDANSKEAAGGNGNNAADKDPEKQWRKRFHEAYAKLAQMEKELDILQRESSKAQTQYYADPQKAMNEGLTRKDINDTDAKIAAKRREIDSQKALIGDMEEDLRKAGGDPGWASPQ
jgi:hypothetical protein